MPKIRHKTNSFGYNKINQSSGLVNNIFKSGVMTYDTRKLKVDQDLSHDFFSDEIIHGDTSNYFSKPYDDNKTINFIEKEVSLRFGIEQKYLNDINFLEQNKVLSSPNKVSINDEDLEISTQRPERSVYNHLLKENYLDSSNVYYEETGNLQLKGRFENIDESNIITSGDFSSLEDNDIITLDYNLRKSNNFDLYLSFSKNESTRQISFPDGTSYYSFNGNTAYFYNPKYTKNNFGPYDYLGNISSDYKADIGTFIEKSPICFSGITPRNIVLDMVSNPQESDNIKKVSYGSIPINNFGFPHESKFSPKDRHTIKASEYITKPFVIEKICLEFTMSNWSLTSGISDITPTINFVNFFVINQKGNLNTSVLKDSLTTRYYDQDENTLTISPIDYSNDSIFTTNNKEENRTFNESEINDMSYHGQVLGDSIHESQYIHLNEIDGIDNKTNSLQQRDLISSITIANYSAGKNNPDNHIINLDKITETVDLVINKSQTPLQDNNNNSECIYTDEKIMIISPVKHFYKNKNLSKFTKFNIYPEKPESNRTNIDIDSKRSLPGENLDNSGTKETINDVNGVQININQNSYAESNYILLPEDSLVFGVSLTPSFKTHEDEDLPNDVRFGEDLVKISNSENYPFKVHLIGHYLENDSKKKITNKSIKKYKRSKRIGFSNLEVVDKFGSDSPIIEQNYYDRNSFGRSGFTITKKINSSKNKIKLGDRFSLPNVNDGSYSNEDYNLQSIFRNGLDIKRDYYKIEENLNSIYILKHYFNKTKYGMISDKLLYNTIYDFIDSKYKNINKRFMKGYYLQKDPCKVSGSISLDFTNIQSFTGKNFLLEKIFLEKDVFSWEDINGNYSSDIHQLKFDITDNDSKKVKFILQIADDKLAYTNGLPSGLVYENDDYYYYLNFPESITDDFENLNFDTTLPPKFNDVKKRIFDIIDQITLSVNSISDFNVESSYNDSESASEIYKINFDITVPGKFKSCDISLKKSGPNVLYENFSIISGEELLSFNTNKNSYYSTDNLTFLDI